ncbi:Monothiol glutaredoxin-7 [Daldinia childiae]|uniref:Monothiol glutaredoxin-7 n=1 Tax=Daldinia childiae TaxID=326645 RepID=UPI0014453FFE|nr:Monothiol glutaredoxin-7 [Daldinia childiae]KAF3062336.1 Monothiol glutaredoxin-7 [Daldinia childiae]
MPSARRVRLLMMVVLAAVITTLFFTSQMRSAIPHDNRTVHDFFGKTMNGLGPQKGPGQVVMSGKGTTVDSTVKDKDGDGSVDEDDEQLAKEMADRLRAAEQKAKDLANAKAPLKPDTPSKVIGIGSSAGGQKKGASQGSSKETGEESEESEEDREVEATLNNLLKKSSVVIFSKSFCPYSKRAKGVLLEKYSIDPAPYVVELDEHPLGKQLQAKLGIKTGRKTVPNIMINGKSVGGSDEIAELDSRKTLIDKFKSMGGKQLSMKERFVGNTKEKQE